MLLLANIGLHQNVNTGMWFGFVMASYSAIANDSIQTLGTFIASNQGNSPWWAQWLWIGTIFLGTTIYSYAAYDGDISYERLKSKGYDTDPTSFNYLQCAAPVILLIFTRLRVPVSTSFMLLTSFVTKSGSLQKSINKSVIGYGISFLLAAVVYISMSKFVSDYCDRTRGALPSYWKAVQWTTTGILWSVWLQQDMSNLAIFLPRSLNIVEMISVCVIIFFGLGIMLYQGGEKI